MFDDADIDAAVAGAFCCLLNASFQSLSPLSPSLIPIRLAGAIACKFRGSGQTCVCANRIYVHSSIYADFASKLAEKVAAFKVGNGLDPATSVSSPSL